MTTSPTQTTQRSPLHDFLAPDSIAIVGASADPTKRGYKAMVGLVKDGYPGKIYPINPKADMILGIKAYPSLADLPGPVDLALICTPAATVPALLLECGKKGVKGAVILASGFRETGPEGAKLEQQVLDAARQGGVRIIGPNTSGMFNLHKKVNLLALANVKAGDIGFISQSGNMLLSLVLEAEHNGHVGFSTYVGPGNQTDIGFNDYLRYLGEDPTHAGGHAVCRRLSRRTPLPQCRTRHHRDQAGGGVQIRLHRTGPEGRQFAHRRAGRQLRDDRRRIAPGRASAWCRIPTRSCRWPKAWACCKWRAASASR